MTVLKGVPMRFEMKSNARKDNGALRVALSFDPAELHMKPTPYGVVLQLDGCTLSGEPGGPGLPSRVIRLALPALSRVGSVKGQATRTVLLNKKPALLAPLQLPQPGDRTKPKGGDGEHCDVMVKPSSLREHDEPFVEPLPSHALLPPRAELYEREARQPRPLARLVATEQVGPVPIAVIEVSPVHLTAEGLLEFATEIEVSVTVEPLRTEGMPSTERAGEQAPDGDMTALSTAFMRPIHSRAQAERLVQLARLRVLNPDAVWDFGPLFPALLTHVDHLVITDNQRWNATTIAPIGPAGNLVAAFQRLADWKGKRGVKSRVVTITDIVAGTYGNFASGARDLQEVIRRFLQWAYSAWGISWVLLGGDIGIVPMRSVPGASEGHIDTQSTDPPPDNKSFWTGTFLKMNVVSPGTWWPGSNSSHLLVRADNGLLIPYDPTGASGPTQRGWYFCTSNSYATRSSTPTNFVRVNGPAGEVDARLQWLYMWNMLPTDLYYASLQGPRYGIAGRHDWDLLDNGIYGQHTDGADFDGVEYETDVSVGRAPVADAAQANAFVDKLIAYEQFRRPDGSSLDLSWPARMLLVSSNWGGRLWIGPTTAMPPGDNQYHHPASVNHSLIKLKDTPTDLQWQLIAQVTPGDVRLLPFDRNAATAGRGWYFAASGTNLTPSGISINIFGIHLFFPIPTQWVAVYGTTAELSPQGYVFDRDEADGSLHDQEQLRTQVDAELPGITGFSRLYEDEVDLTPAQAAAAPVQHLTEDRLRDALNAAPHFVSLSGHGNSDGCCGLSGNMAQNLNNGPHSFIGYADSCLTNQFDAEDAVSEKLLYNSHGGAVAYIGNTRFSWIGVGDNFQRAFFHRLTATRHIGLANDSRAGMVNESTGFYRLYNKWAIFTLNLMGDPEMPVWLGKPKTMHVAFPTVLDKRPPFSVTVKQPFLFGEIPLAGAAVHIQQGAFFRLAFTNAAGVATFDLNPAQLGKLDITVTRIGFKPFIGSARIAGPAWVSGRVTRIIHQHGSTHRSLVQLHLDTAIDGDPDRAWYARDSLPDYGIILDAVTDAYVQDKAISLFVNLTDEGGTIERFAFNYPLRLPSHLVDVTGVRAVDLLPIALPATADSPASSEPAAEAMTAAAMAGSTSG